MPQLDDERLRADVGQLVADGQDVNAVKLVRERTGLGLMAAHRFVAACQAADPQTPARQLLADASAPDPPSRLDRYEAIARYVFVVCAVIIATSGVVDFVAHPSFLPAARFVFFTAAALGVGRDIARRRREPDGRGS